MGDMLLPGTCQVTHIPVSYTCTTHVIAKFHMCYTFCLSTCTLTAHVLAKLHKNLSSYACTTSMLVKLQHVLHARPHTAAKTGCCRRSAVYAPLGGHHIRLHLLFEHQQIMCCSQGTAPASTCCDQRSFFGKWWCTAIPSLANATVESKDIVVAAVKHHPQTGCSWS